MARYQKAENFLLMVDCNTGIFLFPAQRENCAFASTMFLRVMIPPKKYANLYVNYARIRCVAHFAFN